MTVLQVEPISVVDLRTASIIYHPSNDTSAATATRRSSAALLVGGGASGGGGGGESGIGRMSHKPSEAHGLDQHKLNRLSTDWVSCFLSSVFLLYC